MSAKKRSKIVPWYLNSYSSTSPVRSTASPNIYSNISSSSSSNISSSLMNKDGNLRSAKKSLKFDTPSKRLDHELMKEKEMANLEMSSDGHKTQNTDKSGLEISLAAKEDHLDGIANTSMRQDKTLSLLHDHIKEMTSIVRRLSRDMERCEAAVASNTIAIATLTTRISSLDSNGIINTNIDSRINRCDVGITEIVREVRDCNHSIKKMGQQTDEQNTAQLKRNEMMEKRFDDMERAMNNKDTEQNRQMSTLKDQTKELGSVSLSLERDISKDMSQLKATCLNRVDLLLSEIENRYNGQMEIRDLRIGEVSNSLNKAVTQLNGDIDKMKKEQSDTTKSHSRLRGECMSGFKTLQESIDTMHSILDSKIHLIEEDLRSELKKSNQTVVVT